MKTKITYKIVLWPLVEIVNNNLNIEMRFNILHKTYIFRLWNTKKLRNEYSRVKAQNEALANKLIEYRATYIAAERSRILKKKPENRTNEEIKLLNEAV